MAEREKPAGYARSEAKNAEIRATITPLEPGERPGPLLAALAFAAFLLIANVAGYLFASEDVPLAGTIVFTAVMALAIYGLWNARAWAVLGMLALLAIIAASALLSLLVASDVVAVVFCLVVAGVTGTLFWKLIRVLGRIQAPPATP